MRQSFKSIVITVFLLAIASLGFSAISTLTLKGGISYPLCDVNEDTYVKPMGGFSYELWLTRFLSLGISPYASKLEASEDYEFEDEIYTYKFSTNIVGGDLFFKFRPNWRKVTPFVTAGVGILNFFPKDGDGHHITGYDNEGNPADYDYTVMVLPALGGGISIFPHENLNIDLGFQRQSVASDFLDGYAQDKEDDAFWMAYLGLGITFGRPKPAPVVVIPPEPEPVFVPELSMSPSSREVSYQAGVTRFEVKSNTGWIATENEDWLSVTPTSGKGNAILNVNYDENTGNTNRTGVITITGDGITRTVTVVQGIKPPPPPEPLKELNLVIQGGNFEFDKSDLVPLQKSELDRVAYDLTTDFPNATIEVQGHTDYVGTDEYNMALSERRANSAKDYLVSKGVAASRITTVGYGESRPITTNETDEGRALNRRFEIRKTN